MSSIPFVAPIVGPISFSESAVPLFQLNLPQKLQELVPAFTACLLNTAQETINGSNARIFSLNLLSLNNFNNLTVQEFVELAIRFAVQKAFQINNPNAVVGFMRDGVAEALAAKASELAVKNPQLYNSLTPQQAAAANQNFSQFESRKLAIYGINLSCYQTSTPQSNVMGNYSQQYATPVQGYQPNQPLQTPQQNTNNVETGSGWSSNLKMAKEHEVQPQQGTTSYTQMTQEVNNPLKQQNYFNNQQPAYQPQPAQQVVEKPAVQPTQYNSVQHDVHKTSQSSFVHSGNLNLHFNPDAYVRTSQGKNEMNITAHAVPYFGLNDSPLNLSDRRQDFRLDVLKVGKESRVAPPPTEPMLLTKEVGLEISVEPAILLAQTNSFAAGVDDNYGRVFRQFFNILNPVPVVEEALGANAIFTSTPTMNGLPHRFRDLIKTFNPDNMGNREMKCLNYFTYLNKALTDIVNDYLRHSMNITSVRMTSFSEDLDELIGWIGNQFPSEALNSFDAWKASVMSMLKESYNNPVNADYLKDYFKSETLVHFGYIPQTVSITCLDLTDKELDYKVNNKEMQEIRPSETGSLYELIDSLQRNKRDLCVFTTQDWIITSDNVRYRCSEHAIHKGQYFMIKVS